MHPDAPSTRISALFSLYTGHRDMAECFGEKSIFGHKNGILAVAWVSNRYLSGLSYIQTSSTS
jgi:hypothetical protein